MKKQLLILTAILMMFSCKKKDDPAPVTPPAPAPAPKVLTSCFTVDNRIKQTLQSFQFTNCSEHYERSEWNFGDGSSSVISEPSHMYGLPGSYEVKLKTFQGTTTKDFSSRVIAAKTINLTFASTWSNLTATDNQDVKVAIYYSKSNETTWHFVKSDQAYNFKFDKNINASVGVWDFSSKYKFKFEARLTNFDETALKTENLVTGEIDMFTGAANNTGSAQLGDIMKLDYTIGVEYKN